MIKIKMVVGAVILASTMLVGCSSNNDATNATLNSVVTKLNQVQSDIQEAKAEAARANQRLDNLTRTSYKK